MRSRTTTVTRNTLWSTLDLVLDFGLPVLTTVLVARAMGPAKLGEYGYILWLTQMALLLGSVGVPRAASRYLAEHLTRGEESEARGVLRLTLGLQAVIAALLVSIGLGWARLLLPGHEQTYASLAVLSIFPAAMMGIASAVNNAREDFQANVVSSGAAMIVQAGVVVLTLVFGWDLIGLAAALLASRTVDCAVRWALVGARTPPDSRLLRLQGASLTVERRREVVAFCKQSTVLMVIDLVVWNRSEMFFLKRYCDLHEVAFFSLAYTFATIPTQLAAPFSQAAVASLFVEQGRSKTGAREVAEVMARYVALLVLPASLGLAILSRPLVATLYGSRYAAAAPVLALGATFAFAAPLAAAPSFLAMAAGGQASLARWGVVAAGLTLALDFLLVRWGCAAGAAVANGCGQLLSALGAWTIATGRFGLKIDGRFYRAVVLASLGMSAPAALLTQLVPAVAAVVAVPPLGVFAYLLLLKHLRVLDARDANRLTRAASLLPRRVGAAGDRLIRWVVGEHPTAEPGEA